MRERHQLAAACIASIMVGAAIGACGEFGSAVEADAGAEAPDGGEMDSLAPPPSDSSASVDAGGGTTYRAVVLGDGPFAYLRLGETSGDTARNEQVNFNAKYTGADGAVALGAPGAIAGDSNLAVGLDGLTGCIDFGEVNALVFPMKTPFTLEAWVKPSVIDVPRVIFEKMRVVTGDVRGWGLRIQASGKIELRRHNGDPAAVAAVEVVESSTILTASVFTHVAVTFDGSTTTLFMNGAPVGTAPTKLQLPTTTVLFAAGCKHSGSVKNFSGVLDEIAIYDKALAPARIKHHYDTATAP